STGADGINLKQHLSPGTFEDFSDLVVPELQRRGRYRTSYTPGETLRERFYGAGVRHPLPGHPAASAKKERLARQDQRNGSTEENQPASISEQHLHLLPLRRTDSHLTKIMTHPAYSTPATAADIAPFFTTATWQLKCRIPVKVRH